MSRSRCGGMSGRVGSGRGGKDVQVEEVKEGLAGEFVLYFPAVAGGGAGAGTRRGRGGGVCDARPVSERGYLGVK